jgi:hypothetical protein
MNVFEVVLATPGLHLACHHLFIAVSLSASPYPLYGRVVPRADRTDSAYTEELSVEDYREGYGDEQMVASKM